MDHRTYISFRSHSYASYRTTSAAQLNKSTVGFCESLITSVWSSLSQYRRPCFSFDWYRTHIGSLLDNLSIFGRSVHDTDSSTLVISIVEFTPLLNLHAHTCSVFLTWSLRSRLRIYGNSRDSKTDHELG